jgi:phenylacetate-CoA ligase
VNVYPTAVEAIVRTLEIDEFRMVRTHNGTMEELTVEVEATDAVAQTLAGAFHERLGVRIGTAAVPPGSLPRWELKARRLVDRR